MNGPDDELRDIREELPPLPDPVVERVGEILVVRDDLLPGGTKARFLPYLFEGVEELVYASPAEGGMQLALAYTAGRLGRRATVFVAARRKPHPRTAEAEAAGANIVTVRPGYLAVVQARAREYAARTPSARYLELGGASEAAELRLASHARRVADEVGSVEQVWCASGSGLLTRALQRAWPNAAHFAVQVGRPIEDPGIALVVEAPYRFAQKARSEPPFPSCPHYDAKAWELARELAMPGALFWNVAGPSPTIHTRPEAS